MAMVFVCLFIGCYSSSLLDRCPVLRVGEVQAAAPGAERAKDQGQLALEQVEVSACVEVPS